jgi:hypothetical protein
MKPNMKRPVSNTKHYNENEYHEFIQNIPISHTLRETPFFSSIFTFKPTVGGS